MTTCPTWKELKTIVRGGGCRIRDFLDSLPDEHKMAGALALSIAHWHPSERKWMWKHGDFFADSCGLCVEFRRPGIESCGECPLSLVSNCFKANSLWKTAHHVFLGNPKVGLPPDEFNLAADRMYNALVELYRKEWEKL